MKVGTARCYASAAYTVVVCLSACPSATSRYCIETTGRIGQVFDGSFIRPIPRRVVRKFGYLQNFAGTLSQTPDLENFATASRWLCQQKLVDGRARGLQLRQLVA